MSIKVSLIGVEKPRRCIRCRCKLRRHKVAILLPGQNQDNVACIECGCDVLSAGLQPLEKMSLCAYVSNNVAYMQELIQIAEEDNRGRKSA